MKGVSVNKKKTHVLNNTGEAETAVEIVSESRKRSGDGGFGSEGGGGGGSGESISRKIGDNKRTEDVEEETVDGEEDEDEDDEEGEEGEEGQEERPKLDEGFFEIEAIRRKRVRKGKFQYLIKWRGWPETANTWEPLENLQSIADVIDAFEGSLKPGKRGRKRKHKYGGPHSQTKKQQQQHLSPSHDPAAEKYESSTSLNNSSLPDIHGPVDLSGSRDGEAKNAYESYQVQANSGSIGMVRQVSLIEEEKEYDPTLNELRGPVNNSNSAGGIGSEGDNVRTNGFLKVYPKELDKNSRSIGAKRRKSSSVKRFKQDESTTSNNHTATTNPSLTQDLTALDSFGRTKTQELDILKILKPMSFTASVSDNVQEVLVSFLVLRSDGKEVTVDNRFLKAHNPLLLIEFYEQHLKYNRTY